MNHDHLTHLRGGLKAGSNTLLLQSERADVGLDFQVWVLEAGQSWSRTADGVEHAVLVLAGDGELTLVEKGNARSSASFARPSWVETSPWVAHGSNGSVIEVRASSRVELAVVSTANAQTFPGRLYRPEDVSTEHRGKGVLEDTAYRWVRLVFDRTIAPAASRLVLGEVINLPGRWSSYPPHHHRQPEVYYYRFAPEHGYGHGELGSDVFQIKQHDLLCITEGRDHAQVAAPGYHMYYLWAIRHLDASPYSGFEYAKEHEGLLTPRTEGKR